MELERLCKVRRLARQSPEAGERKAAEGRLGALLKKHGLTEADLDCYEGQAARVARPSQAVARWTCSPQGFPGEIEIEIRQGAGFGSIFGFGFSFGFKPMDSGAGTETQP